MGGPSSIDGQIIAIYMMYIISKVAGKRLQPQSTLTLDWQKCRNSPNWSP
jgi:hypothetical protein